MKSLSQIIKKLSKAIDEYAGGKTSIVYRTLHCRKCGDVIVRYKKGSLTLDEIFAKIRHHYKHLHPRFFKQQIQKALRTKREKGLIK